MVHVPCRLGSLIATYNTSFHGPANHIRHCESERTQVKGKCSLVCNTYNIFTKNSSWYIRVLQKGFGYHLDMLVVGLMIGVCSIFGLPWCVAATVLCLGHIDSLKMETETSAPGELPQLLGL